MVVLESVDYISNRCNPTRGVFKSAGWQCGLDEGIAGGRYCALADRRGVENVGTNRHSKGCKIVANPEANIRLTYVSPDQMETGACDRNRMKSISISDI